MAVEVRQCDRTPRTVKGQYIECVSVNIPLVGIKIAWVIISTKLDETTQGSKMPIFA